MAGLTSAAPLLTTIAAGAGGVEEMRAYIISQEPSPLFGLTRVSVGAGSFARSKLLMLHVNPDSVPGIRKAKATSRKGDVRRVVGDVSAEVEVRDPVVELTVEAFLATVSKSIGGDMGGATVNLKAMKAEYEATMAKSRKGGVGGGGSSSGLKSPKVVDLKSGAGRKTAVELRVTTNAALKAVQESMGAFNWALFQPTDKQPLSLMNAGSLSVGECKRFLKDDDACYGVLRLAFGQDRFRRTKHVFVAFCGAKAPISKRAKFSGCMKFMQASLGTHYAVTVQASAEEDFTLPDIIARIRRAAVVDGGESAVEDTYSEEAFLKALEEEAAAAGAFFGDEEGEEEEEGGGGLPSVSEAVDTIRKGDEGALNWALFAVNA